MRNETQPAKLDYRGTVLITDAMGLIVLGFQQSSMWGWSSVSTWACLVVGVLLMVAFVAWELRVPEPLLELRIFRDRGFAVETIVLGLMSIVFVPFFFFASVYSQLSLGETASKAGLYLLYFFLGFVIAPRSAAASSTSAAPGPASRRRRATSGRASGSRCSARS